MGKFARVIDSIAVDVSDGPENYFHPDIASEFEPVPDNVQVGWVRNSEGGWTAPEITEATASAIPLIGPIAFQMLFKVDELVAIDAAKETDPVVRIFWNLLNDPRTDVVDRNLKTVQDGLRYLEAKGLIGAGRAEEILHGSVSK